MTDIIDRIRTAIHEESAAVSPQTTYLIEVARLASEEIERLKADAAKARKDALREGFYAGIDFGGSVGEIEAGLKALLGDAARKEDAMTTYTQADIDVARAEARELALWEAAEKVREWQAFTRYGKERISEEMAQEVYALCAKPALKAMSVEDVTSHLEDVIGETHDLDVTDRSYAEAVIRYLQQNPAALRALAGDTK